jgi:hypothetical protein
LSFMSRKAAAIGNFYKELELWAVTHICNPSYLGGSAGEDDGSSPAGAKS